MQVLPRLERLNELVVTRQVRHDPHFNLAVVSGHESLVVLAHGERLADLATHLRADGDVLEVGVRRGQAPGRGHGLLEGRVDSPVVRHGLQQGLHGLTQLGDVAVLQQVAQERVFCLLKQVLERGRIGCVPGLDLLGLGHVQLVEQDLLELLGRAQVDLTADRLVGRSGCGSAHLCELGFERTQVFDVHCNAVVLHTHQSVRERKFKFLEQVQ